LIKPLKKNVLVVRLKKRSTTESGIILQSDHDGNVDRAEVIAIGSEVTMVKPTDQIFIDWNKANPVTVNNIPHYVINEDNIVWVFEDDSL
jgi:co-chaperonin GroES (HSP10)